MTNSTGTKQPRRAATSGEPSSEQQAALRNGLKLYFLADLQIQEKAASRKLKEIRIAAKLNKLDHALSSPPPAGAGERMQVCVYCGSDYSDMSGHLAIAHGLGERKQAGELLAGGQGMSQQSERVLWCPNCHKFYGEYQIIGGEKEER